MVRRWALFIIVYAAWLAAVAAGGWLDVTGHTMLAFVPAVAVLVATGLAASTAADGRRQWGMADALPWARRAGVLVAVLGGLAFAAASQGNDVYLGAVGRDEAGVVVGTGCVQVAEHGGGCGPTCRYALADGGRVLGWMPCERDGGQVGDRATVRVDPGGSAAAMLTSDAFPAPAANVLAWAGLAGAGLGGVLLCNAICLGPARDRRAALTRA